MIRVKENLPSLVALLASSSTLICCALPALLVLLGAGASLANFITIFPFFIVLSKNKILISIIATVTLSLAGYLNYKTYHMPCPVDPTLSKQCMQTRKRSVYIYIISVFIFIFATIFTYVLPRII
jgi:hypothetical protein